MRTLRGVYGPIWYVGTSIFSTIGTHREHRISKAPYTPTLRLIRINGTYYHRQATEARRGIPVTGMHGAAVPWPVL